jgi:dTDP-4-amino-4,6-dideoxygalactose transaminase
MIRFLDLNQQYLSIRDEIDSAIASVIESTAFVGGQFVRTFEERFAAYHFAEHCIGVGNGTDALEIAIEGLNLTAGSEIIVPANSFIATSEAVTRAGHRVVFCDCDPQTYTVSLEALRRRITPSTEAIVVVHLYGQPCDMDGVLAIAGEHNLKVVEDCAQAHGAEYKGKRIGTFGDVAAFSFYPGKNLGAYGDGGAILMSDSSLEERCRMIANHGRMEKYDHAIEGRNSRLDGLQAAILAAKLPHLDDWTAARRRCAARYRAGLADISDVLVPLEKEWAYHVYHLFVIQSPRRDSLRSFLADHDVQTGIHYPTALPELQAYAYLRQRAVAPVASSISQRLLSLPMGPHLSDEDVDAVCSLVAEFHRRSA